MIRFSAQYANLPFGTLRKGAKWRGGACSGRLVGTRSLGGGGWGGEAALTAGAHWRRLFFTRTFTFECFTIQYHVQMRRESS